MPQAGGFSGALYNKPLLRLLVSAQFITLGFAGWAYLAQSFGKLGMQGLLDAFAIYSFIIAAFMLVLVAEVVDTHYLRFLGAFGLLVGCAAGGYYIFMRDAPHLEPLMMGMALVSFLTGTGLVIAYISLVIGRLLHGKAASAKIARIAEERGAPPPITVSEAMRKGLEMMRVDSAADNADAAEKREYFLIGVSGPYLGQRFALKQGVNSIGRIEGDIILENDKQVSRRHCVINWAGDGITITDQGSTNGTFVGGQKVSEIGAVPGDLIGIGASTFKLGQ